MKRKALCIGILTILIAASLAVTAIAAEGWTIHVNPINILVNGQVFRPRDSRGHEVPVYVTDGVTYAPLRALAEAYGLEVGYDATTHTAIVDRPGTVIREPDLTARDFSYQWRIEETATIGSEKICTAVYAGPLDKRDFQIWWQSFGEDAIQVHTMMLAKWVKTVYPDNAVTLYFVCGNQNLYTAHAGTP